jgi:hypothetical protein
MLGKEARKAELRSEITACLLHGAGTGIQKECSQDAEEQYQHKEEVCRDDAAL